MSETVEIVGHRGNVIIKRTLDEWLDSVDYRDLNDGTYVPSTFSLVFMNFVKLVNGAEGEANKTPPFHLKMLDKLASDNSYVANLCFRGAAKTTLFFEYLAPYCAIFRELKGLGEFDSMIYVSDSMENGVKSARSNLEFRYNQSEFLQEWLPKARFTDNYIEFTNRDGKRFGIKLFGAKTGIRGTKIFGKRPKLAVLDDLVGDEDARSATAMKSIKDTVYKGINYALDPAYRKVILNGTPFNSNDILVEAVESGAWDVNVWPVCERFPCEREEFCGAWEDRFSYDFIMDQYEKMDLAGKADAFLQELMLRLTSEDERLVQETEIREYSRTRLLSNRSFYNFYITTDFAISDKQTADFSVISVWAYNSNGDWFWVDGICERQTMDKTVDDLFRLVQQYMPQSVGIEVSGQQGAFIKWLQSEMLHRNIWFNFASSANSNAPGIRPVANKLARFNLVVPLFKAGHIYFPEEMKTSKIMSEFYTQIRLATKNGIKGKDDCLDTISQLMYLNAWKPSAPSSNSFSDPVWDPEDFVESPSSLSSYIV